MILEMINPSNLDQKFSQDLIVFSADYLTLIDGRSPWGDIKTVSIFFNLQNGSKPIDPSILKKQLQHIMT